MNSYPQRVADSLLPLSVAGTVPEAAEEWRVTGKVVDHEFAEQTCQLCGQEHVRYHFEIENAFTRKTLWTGSQCILRFEVAVFEDGERVRGQDAKKALNRLIEAEQHACCLAALDELARIEHDERFGDIRARYARDKRLTPKQAAWVFSRLAHHRIRHTTALFAITLKKAKYRQDLRGMPEAQRRLVQEALTSEQRTAVQSR